MNLEPTSPRPWQARLPFFYGWVIVGVSVLISLFGPGLFWGGSVFVNPMLDELGWSRSSIYLAFSVRGWMGVVLSPIFGRFADQPRGALILTVGTGILSALGIVLCSVVTEEWQFVLCFGVLSGVGIVGQSLPTYALVPKWFVRKRGSALGWASMGSPIAAMAMAPALAVLIAASGWRTAWLVLGMAAFTLAVLPAFLIRRQPEDIGLLPDGDPAPPPAQPGAAARAEELAVTPSQAVRQGAFWLLVFGTSMGALSNNGLPASLVPLFADLGFSRDMAVLGFTFYGVFSMLGRFFWGYLVERWPIRHVVVAMSVVGMIVSPAVFVLPGDLTLAYAALNGFVIGGYVALSPMVWPEYFGRRYVGAISGLARPFVSVLQSGGAIMMAMIYDAFGSYDLSLWLLSVSWALCLVAMLVVPRRAAAVRA